MTRQIQARVEQVRWKNGDAFDSSPERTVALRKLLEGKDAAVRASLPEPNAA